ncbi:hypothetical protein PUN28_018156 [Cardiocondyla obscurior]|uniref:Ribosomal protein S14 n=1 Tax=Cardiocondyla obscurior TaxID=286306 RepID=A0AAW2EJY0_9HYME
MRIVEQKRFLLRGFHAFAPSRSAGRVLRRERETTPTTLAGAYNSARRFFSAAVSGLFCESQLDPKNLAARRVRSRSFLKYPASENRFPARVERAGTKSLLWEDHTMHLEISKKSIIREWTRQIGGEGGGGGSSRILRISAQLMRIRRAVVGSLGERVKWFA